jgi:short-subunit dehydrogenase
MSLRDRKVLLTGAAGGIGRAILTALRQQGARVLLTGRDAAVLQGLVEPRDLQAQHCAVAAADLTQPADRQRLCEMATRWQGGIDVLINNAGVSELALLHTQSAEAIERAFATNVIAPIDLCRHLLPHLQRREQAQIVNIGSVLGSIGHPAYSVYCATKFALRGFSEALRRELADTRVRVHYLAPRATQTAINSPAAQAMTAALGSTPDPPGVVAAALLEILQQGRSQQLIGWPEKLFACINALLPSIVDGALRRQLPMIRHHADPASALPMSADQQLINEGRSSP